MPEPTVNSSTNTSKPVDTSSSMDRRSFIKWSAVGWGAFAAVVAGYGALVTRYLFPNVLFEPPRTLIHRRTLAPVLSATFNLVSC